MSKITAMELVQIILIEGNELEITDNFLEFSKTMKKTTFPKVVCLKMLRGKDNKLKDLKISTVDGFQCKEKEVIIILLVRSNSKKEVGFLNDRRLMNVALILARRQCCIVCDTETVSHNRFLKRLVEYFEEHGE